MNIVKLDARPKAPNGLADDLRALADAVDKGECTGAVVASVKGGEWEFIYADSLVDCLVMATLLQQKCIDRLRDN